MLQKSINDKKFNDVFVEVPYLETLGQHANEQLRLFRMKEVISNRFSKTSLQEFLEWNVGQYVFSRSQIEQFELEGNVFSVGMEALDLARKYRPDLILMDIQLPEVSGLEVTKWLKEDDELHVIPVIAVTAFAMKGDEERIRQGGCEAYVSKPISVPKFIETIKTYLGDA